MRANALPRALLNTITVGAIALMGFGISPAFADDLRVAYVTPAALSPETADAAVAPMTVPLRPSFSADQPALTNDLLQAYVAKQLALKQQLDSFNVAPTTALTPQVLLGYIEKTRSTNNLALNAINQIASQPALSDAMLSSYAANYVPTVKKLQVASSEKLCLTEAIYHEARGESLTGQWAVANVIINRANSHRFPTTLCGVVYQNADQGYHRCQFTFACDGKSDAGTETGAWNRASQLASVAYKEFKAGDTPGVLPDSALYYHTTAVDPSWSNDYRQVAVIGAHEFYSVN